MRRMPVLARFTPLAILIVASGCGAVASDRAADVAPASPAISGSAAPVEAHFDPPPRAAAPEAHGDETSEITDRASQPVLAPPPRVTRRCSENSAWTCRQRSQPGGPWPRVASIYLPRTVDVSWLGLPSPSLHPSAMVVLEIDGMDELLASRPNTTCEQDLRLFINTHRLDQMAPTLCDEATGRVMFQLRNLPLDVADEVGQPTAWRRLLATRSHTFWTDAEVSAGWYDGPPLPTDITWDARTVLWLVPPVNAWIAVIGVTVVLALLLDLHMRSNLLREPPPGDRYSLSRVQGAWWLICVFASWEILCAFKRDFAPIGSSALVLLGIAGGTYSGVRWLTQDNKEPAGGRHRSRGLMWDIASEDGQPALHRIQMVAWSLAVGVGYVYGTIIRLELPEVDPTLLALMGLSAAGYVSLRKTESTTAEAPPATPSGGVTDTR
ncbi:MAG TPA: hypothetical protein PKA64_19025 [Myxococcota bacterium]|nr:hypothetical protein [Myxococcota bacterium]